jgi:hypothetical protein
MTDDLAHHRLRPAQVRRRLADRERSRQCQVLEHSQRGVRQLAARRVPPVEGQVHSPEELLELPG